MKNKLLAFSIVTAMIYPACAIADWTIYNKETPKSRWERFSLGTEKTVDPWPYMVSDVCRVTLARDNYAVKAINDETGEERSELCDNVNKSVAEQEKKCREAESSPRSPNEGKVKLW